MHLVKKIFFILLVLTVLGCEKQGKKQDEEINLISYRDILSLVTGIFRVLRLKKSMRLKK